MKTTVSSRGRIALPAELRRRDGVAAGQRFEIQRLDRGDYRLVRTESLPNDGVVDWLLDCPINDFFTSIQSEATDAL